MNRQFLLSLSLLIVLVVVPAAWAFTPDDRLVSDPAVDIVDPEFDPVGNRMVWQDLNGNMWLAYIDPVSGAISPPSGKALHIDSGLADLFAVGNGPEWVYGTDGVYIAYTKVGGQGARYLTVAKERPDGKWSVELLNNSRNRWRPFGSPPSNTEGPARIVYVYRDDDKGKVVGWRDIRETGSERTISVTAEGGRWVEGERSFVSMNQIAGIDQVVLIDAVESRIFQLTTDADEKLIPYMWFAPEFQEFVFLTIVNRNAIGIYRQIDGRWQRYYTFQAPSNFKFVNSPEPFVTNGRSYVTWVAAEKLEAIGPLKLQPVGNTEIWIAGIEPQQPFFRRVDDPAVAARKSEPEPFITRRGAAIYYTQRDEATERRLLRIAHTGLLPEYGYDSFLYGGAWAGRYRDNRNCSCTPFPIPDRYTAVISPPGRGRQYVGATLGPEGNLYLPREISGSNNGNFFFSAYDSYTHRERFILNGGIVGPESVRSGSLIGEQGELYLPGENRVARRAADGTQLWSTTVDGTPQGLQFTRAGDIVVFTPRGRAYVLESTSGSVLLSGDIADGRMVPSASSCEITGEPSDCVIGGVPAADVWSGTYYAAFVRDDGYSELRAYRIAGPPYSLQEVWRSGVFNGRLSAPVLSSGRGRLYAQDSSGRLHALDAGSGRTIWSFDVGAGSTQPPVVGSDGYLMPGGTGRVPGIIHDDGGSARWSFQAPQYVTASPAAAGAGARFVVVASDPVRAQDRYIVVMHGERGLAGVTPWGDGGAVDSIEGLVLRDDSWLFVNTSGDSPYRAFQPVGR